MAIQNYILIVESALALVLSLYVLFRNRHNPINQAFFVMVFGVAVWVISNGLDVVTMNSWLTRMTFVGAILIAVGFLYFSYYFPFSSFVVTKSAHFLTVVPGLVMIVLLVGSNWFIVGLNEDGTRTITGPVYDVFAVMFLVYWTFAVINYLKKYKYSDGLHRWQLRYFFFAVIFSFVAGVTTNLLIPWIFDNWSLYWVGPSFSIIFISFLSYILFKKEVA